MIGTVSSDYLKKWSLESLESLDKSQSSNKEEQSRLSSWESKHKIFISIKAQDLQRNEAHNLLYSAVMMVEEDGKKEETAVDWEEIQANMAFDNGIWHWNNKKHKVAARERSQSGAKIKEKLMPESDK